MLTASRVHRLSAVLSTIRASRPPGLPRDRAVRILWKVCGGPLDEVPLLLEIAETARLVVRTDDFIKLTRAGREVATQDHQHGGRLLARRLIDSGVLSREVVRLSEALTLDQERRVYSMQRKRAVEAAPQLVALLRRWPTVVVDSRLTIPDSLVELLFGADALEAPIPARLDNRKSIGDRGELLSYLLQRELATDPGQVKWVAREVGEHLGYDLEDGSSAPSILIEAKASGSSETKFYMSRNELRVAEEEAGRYMVHFWGEVNLDRSAREEFLRLREAGYPRVFVDPVHLIRETGDLRATPESFLVTEGSGGD